MQIDRETLSALEQSRVIVQLDQGYWLMGCGADGRTPAPVTVKKGEDSAPLVQPLISGVIVSKMTDVGRCWMLVYKDQNGAKMEVVLNPAHILSITRVCADRIVSPAG